MKSFLSSSKTGKAFLSFALLGVTAGSCVRGIEPLTPDPTSEVLPILQAKFADFPALQFKPGEKLDDVIARSEGKVGIVSAAEATISVPIITASLPGQVIYWRLSSFLPKTTWADMEAEFKQTSLSSTGLILDLRSNTTPDDYAGAAQTLKFFAPQDVTLGKFASNTPFDPLPARAIPIIVLVNAETRGAAEALAACLKIQGALIMGQPTAGKAAVFAEQKLSSGQVLRYAVETILLADGTSLWGHPVMPDLMVKANSHSEKAALVLIRNNHVLDVIKESAKRERLSEAALVQDEDPEWNAYLVSLEQKSDDHYQSLPPIHDVTLINALDSLKAIELSQKSSTSSPSIVSLPTGPSLIQ